MARGPVALPGRVTDLPARLHSELEKLEKTAPLAVLRAARRMEVVAEAAYWPAREASGAERAQREQGPDAGQPLPSTPRLPAVAKPRTGTAAPAAAKSRQIRCSRCGSALAADAARHPPHPASEPTL
ncbi:MAG: hypothetical protein JF597_45440 [Streptomyces sp.]|uniref:hypothetical protein n=1 Tax=Streptomyces sp. TaxID=1931 RepID=UPI0025F06617|nr:hypothetical protein [Streptomyces sp.]MBW8800563.1 hypothetical protein [Streptomyces sp.]